MKLWWNRLLRWWRPLVLILVLIVLAGSTRWWLRPFFTFVGANTDLIQGLTDLVQLVLWLGAAAVVFYGF